jgi:Domain of unknown function (DUF4258)
MSVDIDLVRERVRDGKYLVRSHAVVHALKEGFDHQQIVEAVLNGKVVEAYPADPRVLICGKATLAGSFIYLHVICEYADEVYVEFITAYIPDELLWEHPPFRRRKQK